MEHCGHVMQPAVHNCDTIMKTTRQTKVPLLISVFLTFSFPSVNAYKISSLLQLKYHIRLKEKTQIPTSFLSYKHNILMKKEKRKYKKLIVILVVDFAPRYHFSPRFRINYKIVFECVHLLSVLTVKKFLLIDDVSILETKLKVKKYFFINDKKQKK